MKTLTLIASLLLVACGGAADDQASKPEPFKEMTESLDKAAEVEKTLQEQKERMDRAVEEAEQPPEAR